MDRKVISDKYGKIICVEIIMKVKIKYRIG